MRERERWRTRAGEWPRWDERNRILAAYIPPGSAVVDLGSGAQTLREHLPAGGSYQPCDLVAGPAPVIPCDLEAGRWRELPRRYDVAVCSGVLEYMSDVGAVLAGLGDVAPRALVTYSDRRPGQRIETLRRHGWKSFLTLGRLRAALDASGAAWRFLTEWHGHVIAVLDFAPDLPPLADGEAVIEDAAWEAGFADLEDHARTAGTSAVAPSLVADGRAIGLWAEAQRRLRRRGTLSARRAERLESLPGWSWRPRTGSGRAQRPAEDPGALRARRVARERPDWI